MEQIFSYGLFGSPSTPCFTNYADQRPLIQFGEVEIIELNIFSTTMPSPSCVTLSCETNLVEALAMTSPLFPSHEPARADRHPSSSFYSSAAPPLPAVDVLHAVSVFHTIGLLPNIAIFPGIDYLPLVGLCYVHQ